MAKKMIVSAKSTRRKKRKTQKLAMERAKEFSYKGYTLDELLELKMEELITILPARARRTLKRGWNEEQNKLVEKLLNSDKEVIKTHIRDVVIIPQFVGKRVMVHNGKEYLEFEIKPEMIGHYLGEYSLTRREIKHSSPGVGATKSSKYVPLK
ncbi:MAG: 30S ribosomal protein S19 [Thermoplasmata archaeon]